MIRTNQGGSVASFIIVAALLVLGTAGLLYFVKRGDAPKVATPQVAVTDKNKQSNTSKNAQKVDESEGSKTQSTTNSSQQANNSPTKTDNSGQSSTAQQNTQSVAELSHTGPVDDFMHIVMAGVFATILVAYLQSRQQLATSRSSL